MDGMGLIICRQTVLSNAYYEYHAGERLNNRYVIKSSIGKVCLSALSLPFLISRGPLEK